MTAKSKDKAGEGWDRPPGAQKGGLNTPSLAQPATPGQRGTFRNLPGWCAMNHGGISGLGWHIGRRESRESLRSRRKPLALQDL